MAFGFVLRRSLLALFLLPHAITSALTMLSPSPKILRVLALHGSGGNAASFQETLNYWNTHLHKEGVSLEITALNAPIENGRDGGYSWWSMPPGVRSYQATEYNGFDESSALVMDTLRRRDTFQFDLILGHSQGGILLTSLLAQDRLPYHPQLGYILNGVAWPNPFTRQLENLKFSESLRPRILMITGDTDTINPPEQGARVHHALQTAGGIVETIHHQGGHAVPVKSGKTLDEIIRWILTTGRVAASEDETQYGVSYIGGDPCGSKLNDDPFDAAEGKPGMPDAVKNRIAALAEEKKKEWKAQSRL